MIRIRQNVLKGMLAAMACLFLLAPRLAAAAEAPKVVHDWPEYRGPNGQFGDTSKVPLADSMTAMKLLWESEEQGIGFGKSHSGYGGDISYGGDLGPSGIGSPIVAGGLVIMSYFTPSGDVIDETFKARNKPEVWEKHQWKCKVAADDVVIGIDAATGKTRWKQVFAGVGRNGGSGKRNLYGSTPIAYQGRVYALGSCGAIYCLDLATGKVMWQTPNEPALEAAKKEALAGKDVGKDVGIPTGWLMVHDDVLIVPVGTGWNLVRGGKTRGVSLADGQTLWELPGHPGLLAYATIEGRKCLVNAGICIEPKTGKILWQQKAEQTYNGPPVVAGNVLIGYVPHPKSDPPGVMGTVAGFQLDLTGAKKIWTLDERFHREIVSDAGGFRFFAVRDNLLYNVTPSSDTPGKKGTGGYELQVYDAFADGLVFMRVFGGIRCYDLRGNLAK